MVHMAPDVDSTNASLVTIPSVFVSRKDAVILREVPSAPAVHARGSGVRVTPLRTASGRLNWHYSSSRMCTSGGGGGGGGAMHGLGVP